MPGYNILPRPAGTSYQVIRTRNFEIIFESGYAEEARAAVRILHAQLDSTRTLLGHHHPFHMPVVLNGFNDLSNGYVTPLPFKQEIELASFRGRSLSPLHDTWLDVVLPHELVHAVQADLRKGFGFAGLFRPIFPDFARVINFLVPPGISEGLAVYRESRLRPAAGRLNHSFFTMQFRAAMMSDKPWSMAQLVEAPAYSQPADRFYLGGAHLVNYLAERDSSLAFFHRSSALHYRIPFLGYGVGLWYGMRQWPARVYRAFKADAIEKEKALQSTMGEITSPAVLASEKGYFQRRPRWISDEELVVFQRGYGTRSGFYVVDVRTGQSRLLRNTLPVSDYVYDLSVDRSELIYAHYRADPFIAGKRIADLYAIDLRTGDQRRITRNQRLASPAFSEDGIVWASMNDGQDNQLAQVDGAGGTVRLSDFEDTRILEIAPAPGSGRVAILINIRGYQGVFWVEFEGAQPVLRPFIMFENGSVYDLSWSDDGRRLFFTADPRGVSNIFTYDVGREEAYQVTNARYGALEPSLSPDGKTLAYIDYQHERFDLVLLPYADTAGFPVSKETVSYGKTFPWMAWTQGGDSPIDTLLPAPSRYKAFAHLAPRAVLPIIRSEENQLYGDKRIGPGYGLSFLGADPLQRVSYIAEGYGQAGRLWGGATISADAHAVQPYLSIYNTLSTVMVGLIDDSGASLDHVRVGRERRGVTAGVRVPVFFNRNVFQSGMVVGARGVLKDERYYTIDGAPFERRYTIEPAASFFYRIQSNPRDLIPNHGLALSINGTFDLNNKAGPENRALIARLTGFLPFLHDANIGLRAYGALLTQNRGGIYNLDNFLPGGYEDQLFLGSGNHVVAGFEYVQPLWYVDDGLFILPFYIKALYAFGFSEGLLTPGASAIDSAIRDSRAFSSGAGLGIRFRVYYLFDFDVRFVAAYRHASKSWTYLVR